MLVIINHKVKLTCFVQFLNLNANNFMSVINYKDFLKGNMLNYISSCLEQAQLQGMLRIDLLVGKAKGINLDLSMVQTKLMQAMFSSIPSPNKKMSSVKKFPMKKTKWWMDVFLKITLVAITDRTLTSQSLVFSLETFCHSVFHWKLFSPQTVCCTTSQPPVNIALKIK